MEQHLIQVVTFVFCIVVTLVGAICMCRAGKHENHAQRRLAALLALLLLYFSREIGARLYLITAGLIEAGLWAMLVGLILLLGLSLMMFPLVKLIRYLIH